MPRSGSCCRRSITTGASIVNLDHLRQYVGLRGIGQRDPLIEYKSEAFELFEALLSKLRFASSAS
jgi:preprotein translocase subunit SecA